MTRQFVNKEKENKIVLFEMVQSSVAMGDARPLREESTEVAGFKATEPSTVTLFD